jgi:hypothetical protein
MRLSFGPPRAEAIIAASFGAQQLNLLDLGGAIHFQSEGIEVYLEGVFYYVTEDEQPIVISEDSTIEMLRSAFRKYGSERFSQHVEGMYVGLWIDQDQGCAGLFGDAFNRLALYWHEEKGSLVASTKLLDVVHLSSGYDQYSLYSYLFLGYPGGKDTFYKGISRLGSDEHLRFSSQGLERRQLSQIKKIQKLDKSELDRYDALLSNAVGARSAKTNVVMNSGGWDSTSLIFQLTRHHEAKCIQSAVFDVILPDGQSFNTYEVDKAKRIADFYGIKTDRAIIDYSDKGLLDYWDSKRDLLRENHTYFWLHHLKIADQIGEGSEAGTRVFNGEASDSIHNFGFSQFVSVNYDNMQLREYADKAKSYLYGPSFFDTVLKGTYHDDKVLNFFHGYYGAEKFDSLHGASESHRRMSYFQAFMLSYPRVPFAKWQTSVATAELQRSYANFVSETYFSDITTQAQPDTLYYWLLQLYRRFHFHSFQISINHTALAPHGLSCSIPFQDMQLVDFMYQMPEDWGRGLELRTTKYPLRHLAEHKWRMPLHILTEPGPHSYIAESDRRWSYAGGSWNIYCEIMFKSVFKSYFQTTLKDAKLEDVFDGALFNLTAMQEAVNCYVAGEERIQDVSLLFRLATLLSIGFLR